MSQALINHWLGELSRLRQASDARAPQPECSALRVRAGRGAKSS